MPVAAEEWTGLAQAIISGSAGVAVDPDGIVCSDQAAPEAIRVLAGCQNQLIDRCREGRLAWAAPAGLDSFTPLFAKIAAGEAGELAQSQGLTCTGCPHPCPRWRWLPERFPDHRQALAFVEQQGFHQTPFYASLNRHTVDYTRVLASHWCEAGAFRAHGRLVYIRHQKAWRFRVQQPEPNPEILHYRWPVWWWPAYVAWWHSFWS